MISVPNCEREGGLSSRERTILFEARLVLRRSEHFSPSMGIDAAGLIFFHRDRRSIKGHDVVELDNVILLPYRNSRRRNESSTYWSTQWRNPEFFHVVLWKCDSLGLHAVVFPCNIYERFIKVREDYWNSIHLRLLPWSPNTSLSAVSQVYPCKLRWCCVTPGNSFLVARHRWQPLLQGRRKGYTPRSGWISAYISLDATL